MRLLFISLIIFFGVITFGQSETSWIKKKDKTEKVEKKSNSWIKKKEVKENKKKLKEKLKESKSWITKKSKEKVKDIKKKLKDHKTLDELPKAEFYFAAVIEPKEGEKVRYVYGYTSSDKSSKIFNFNDKEYFSKSDGIAYFDNKENICEVDSQIGSIGSTMMGEVVLQCNKNLQMTGGFRQIGTVGKGDGETSNGNNVKFEFYTSKSGAIAKLENYKEDRNKRTLLAEKNNNYDQTDLLNLKTTGKYYALLIGNSKYINWASLNSPKNDVKAISNVLNKKYNFEKVTTLLDATKDEIFESLNELRQTATDKDYVLIYYSGHGDRVSDKTYWIPIDGQKKWKIGNWISISEVSDYMENFNAHHLVLMVDSCYTGSSFKGSSTSDFEASTYDKFKILAQKLLDRRVRYVLSSGGNEPVDDSFNGKHSIFAKTVIDLLKKSEVINMQAIYRAIDIAHAGMDQRPYLYTPDRWAHGGGDFIFVAKK